MAQKVKAWSERFRGNLKTGIGRVVGNPRLSIKGRGEQTKGNARQAAKKTKDTFTQ